MFVIDKKIKSLQDLERLRSQMQKSSQDYKARVLICMTGCRALGARDVVNKFRDCLKKRSLEGQISVVETGCIGLCALAPVVLIEPNEYLYGGVQSDDVDEIVTETTETLENGRVVERLAAKQDNKAT